VKLVKTNIAAEGEETRMIGSVCRDWVSCVGIGGGLFRGWMRQV
jgi:hypothetical protein